MMDASAFVSQRKAFSELKGGSRDSVGFWGENSRNTQRSHVNHVKTRQ